MPAPDAPSETHVANTLVDAAARIYAVAHESHAHCLANLALAKIAELRARAVELEAQANIEQLEQNTAYAGKLRQHAAGARAEMQELIDSSERARHRAAIADGSQNKWPADSGRGTNSFGPGGTRSHRVLGRILG